MSGQSTSSAPPAVLQATTDLAYKAAFAREIPNQIPFEITSVPSANDGLRILRQREDIACIVSDHDLADVDGVSFLEMVRIQRSDLPFLLFENGESHQRAARAIQARVIDQLLDERVRDQWAHLASLISRVSALCQAEGPISDHESRAETILKRAGDAMAIAQEDAFVYANEPALDLFGAEDCQTLCEKCPLDLVSPEMRDLASDTFTAIQGGETLVARLEQEIVRIDGQTTPTELTVAGIDWRQKPSLLLLYRDLSEQTPRARIRDRHSTHLEALAEIISHDLQNPLIAAQGRLALAREECESEHLEALGAVLDRMDSVLDSTVTLARLDGTSMDREAIPLTAVITSSWRREQTADATLAVADELTIRGDMTHVAHLFEQLFQNAVDHAGDDVTVRVGRLGEHGFYVEDDGPGIPEAERDQVMDSRHTAAITGTGLGLAIVTQIATLHGWEVAITAKTDGGTRIEFTNVEVVS